MNNLQVFTATVNAVDTQSYLLNVLGDKKEHFITNLTSLVNNDKGLQECEPWSVINAAITATSLNLPLNKNLGYAYVIPYKNGQRKEAQYQMGYKGFVQLAMRSGQFVRINASDVREGELQGYNRLTGDISFEWDNSDERDKKPIIGYVAYFRLVNGFSKSLYMTKQEMENHAMRYSQTYRSTNDYTKKNSKWTTDYDAMALKTVLKLLLSKYAPMSVDMQTAIDADQSVQHEQGKYIYVDNDKTEAKARLAELAQQKAGVAEPQEVEEVEATVSEDNKDDVDKLPFDDD